jgi:hypothetical protein
MKKIDQGVIDVSELPAGMYMIQFLLEDKTTVARKVCVGD